MKQIARSSSGKTLYNRFRNKHSAVLQKINNDLHLFTKHFVALDS